MQGEPAPGSRDEEIDWEIGACGRPASDNGCTILLRRKPCDATHADRPRESGSADRAPLFYFSMVAENTKDLLCKQKKKHIIR